jgi:phospholipid-binding lipoprotein MlaA
MPDFPALSWLFKIAPPARRRLFALAGCVGLSLAGCAPHPAQHPDEPSPSGSADTDADNDVTADPLESVNRYFFGNNQRFDKYLLRPLARGYQIVFPQLVQNGIANILSNLSSPAVLMNDLLQGNLPCASDTASRIGINTTLGVAGFFDVARAFGVPRHQADFGQTLGAWGVDSGPFLYLPVFGPSDVRDAVGFGVDLAADPFTLEFLLAPLREAIYVRYTAIPLDFRARNMAAIDDINRNSLDPYATVRNIGTQLRSNAVAAALAPVDPKRCSLRTD